MHFAKFFLAIEAVFWGSTPVQAVAQLSPDASRCNAQRDFRFR